MLPYTACPTAAGTQRQHSRLNVASATNTVLLMDILLNLRNAIATEVLGRPAGFDPQSDSTVRVQAGRQRVKLAEYYAQEGTNDPVLVEIPKGSYALTFTLRPSKSPASHPPLQTFGLPGKPPQAL